MGAMRSVTYLLIVAHAASCAMARFVVPFQGDDSRPGAQACVARCRLAKPQPSGSSDDFLNCVAGCPGATVLRDRRCSDADAPKHGFCHEESWVTTGGRIGGAIAGFLLVVGATVAVFAATFKLNNNYP